VGTLLFMVGATLVAFDVFRGHPRGSTRTKRAR
jgi:hypothetical protein